MASKGLENQPSQDEPHKRKAWGQFFCSPDLKNRERPLDDLPKTHIPGTFDLYGPQLASYETKREEVQ